MSRLRLYETFRAVMMTGSVTGAAKLLSRTQPAISRTLAELEAKAGAKLFERIGGKMTPTDEAHALLPDIEATLKKLNDLDRKVEMLASPTLKALSIAIVPAYSIGFAARLTKALQAVYTDVRLTLLVRDQSVIIELVAEGAADIGICGATTRANLKHRVLARPGLVCAMAPDHPLSRLSTVSGQNLNGENFIAFDHESSPLHITRQIVERAGGSPATVIETQRTHTACALAAAGLGVTLVEPITALSFPAKDIAIRPFTPTIRHPMTLVFGGKSSTAQLAQRIICDVTATALDEIEKRLAAEKT